MIRAAIDDAELINSWRNDPETLRLLSLRKHPFTIEETKEWLSGILSDDTQKLYWLRSDNYNTLLVREVEKEAGQLLTIYFNPAHKISAVRDCLELLDTDRKLLAETKEENKVMRKILLKMGFEETGRVIRKGCKLIKYRKN